MQKHEQSKIEAIREDVEFFESERECKCISQMDKHEGNSTHNVLAVLIFTCSGMIFLTVGLVLAGVAPPDPVFFCSVEPPSLSQQKQLSVALKNLEREDPSLRVRYDEETGQTVLEGKLSSFLYWLNSPTQVPDLRTLFMFLILY